MLKHASQSPKVIRLIILNIRVVSTIIGDRVSLSRAACSPFGNPLQLAKYGLLRYEKRSPSSRNRGRPTFFSPRSRILSSLPLRFPKGELRGLFFSHHPPRGRRIRAFVILSEAKNPFLSFRRKPESRFCFFQKKQTALP